jgi:glycosyltransferase involved in cell wall biosynthesis
MPTWNRARFVAEAVASVLGQSHGTLELVVVDDGSTDDTRDVLAAIRDPRLRLVATAHRGIGAALNTGLAVASGEVVARLDSDDLWLPTMLADQLAALAGHPDVDVVHARSQVIDGNGRRCDEYWGRPLRFPDDPLLSLLYVDPICTVTAVYRRRLLGRVGPWPEHVQVGEDADLNLRVALAGGRFLFRDAVVALNRRHPGNQSGDPTRFHAGRRAVLDAFYARPDLPAGALAMRRLAYSNLDTEHGLHLHGARRWREASGAFATAIAGAPNPVRAAARIAWLMMKS